MTDIPDRYSEDLDQYVEQVERDGLLSAPPWLKREILEAAGITADKEGSAAMASREERKRSFRQYTAEVIFAMAASLVLLFLPSGTVFSSLKETMQCFRFASLSIKMRFWTNRFGRPSRRSSFRCAAGTTVSAM